MRKKKEGSHTTPANHNRNSEKNNNNTRAVLAFLSSEFARQRQRRWQHTVRQMQGEGKGVAEAWSLDHGVATEIAARAEYHTNTHRRTHTHRQHKRQVSKGVREDEKRRKGVEVGKHSVGW